MAFLVTYLYCTRKGTSIKSRYNSPPGRSLLIDNLYGSLTFCHFLVYIVPYAPPSNLNFARLQTSIKATWDNVPMNKRNGIIRSYRILFQNNETGMYLTNITVDGNVKQYQFTNLEVFTCYIFSIVAFTRIGDGPVETRVVYTEESGEK